MARRVRLACSRVVAGSAASSLRSRRGQAVLQAQAIQQFRPGHEKERLRLLRRQGGQVDRVAVEQRPPTASALLRVQRQPREQQRVEVAPNRPVGHLETLRQLGGGHLSVGLQEQRYGHEALGAHERKVSNK